MADGFLRGRSGWVLNTLLVGFCVGVLLFLILPMLVIIPLSFSPSRFFVFPPTGFSTRWYVDFLTNPIWTQSLVNSLIVGGLATIVATTLGTLAAWGLSASTSRWTGLVTAFLIAPMAIPIVVVAVACFLFYSLAGIANGYVGLVVAHAALGLPFVVIAVAATLKGFNRNLVLAAESLGASPVYAFLSITAPTILPGILVGALFAFVISFDEVIVAVFLTSPQLQTLPVQIFAGTRDSITPTITAAATILMALSAVLMLLVQRLGKRGAGGAVS